MFLCPGVRRFHEIFLCLGVCRFHGMFVHHGVCRFYGMFLLNWKVLISTPKMVGYQLVCDSFESAYFPEFY